MFSQKSICSLKKNKKKTNTILCLQTLLSLFHITVYDIHYFDQVNDFGHMYLHECIKCHSKCRSDVPQEFRITARCHDGHERMDILGFLDAYSK